MQLLCTGDRLMKLSTSRIYCAALVFAFVLVRCSFGSAQDSPGIAPHSSIESKQYDTIDLQTLNITLNVPILEKSGRLPFSFGYVLNTNYSGSIQSGLVFNALVAPRDSGTAFGGVVSNTATDKLCRDKINETTEYSAWRYTDAFGTVHSFSGKTDQNGCLDSTTFTIA